jgi:hypothetical protein
MDWIEVDEGGNMDEDRAPILTHYSDQPNVEHVIMDTNSKQFCLMETTPLMQEPLVGLLCYLGNTEAARQILEGTFICPPLGTQNREQWKTLGTEWLKRRQALMIYHHGHHPLLGDDILDHKYDWYLRQIHQEYNGQ